MARGKAARSTILKFSRICRQAGRRRENLKRDAPSDSRMATRQNESALELEVWRHRRPFDCRALSDDFQSWCGQHWSPHDHRGWLVVYRFGAWAAQREAQDLSLIHI